MQLSQFNPWKWGKNEESEDFMRKDKNHPLRRFQSEMNQLFQEVMKDFDSEDSDFWGIYKHNHFRPAIDVKEENDKYIILAEIPGVNKEDLSVEISGNKLVISGEKKGYHQENKDSYYHVERSYGKFKRVLELPDNIKSEEIDASFENGVLHIDIPKSETTLEQKKLISIR